MRHVASPADLWLERLLVSLNTLGLPDGYYINPLVVDRHRHIADPMEAAHEISAQIVQFLESEPLLIRPQ